MSCDIMTVVQCWDDGVNTDLQLIEILRRHGAKASFNLNPGHHVDQRAFAWDQYGTALYRFGWDEMREVYEGFTIANHALTHSYLEKLPIEEARQNIAEGRDRLQQYFQQDVAGFAYPYGTYNKAVAEAVREAGHLYARTIRSVDNPFPPDDPMEFHPTCHFLAEDLWERYERARNVGVFYFWGHSYEIVNDAMWTAFEETIERISNDPAAQWADVADLFAGSV